MQIFKTVPKLNYMKLLKPAMVASLVVILAGIASLTIKRGPDLGVEFTGGVLIQLHFREPPPLSKIRTALAGIGQGDSLVQQLGEEKEIILRLRPSDGQLGATDQVVAQGLLTQFPKGAFEIRRVEAIGPQVSRDLLRRAIWAVFYSLLGILVYVGIRFKFVFGFAGVVALLHDLLVTVGVLSIAGKEWTLPVVAAFLTIAGFSINDTIVIFDRIRENLRLHHRDSLPDIINLSVNQTLARTVLTNGTVFVVTVALLFFGGQVIRDFAYAMTIGVIVGTYSSVFIAAPIVVLWHKKPRADRGSPKGGRPTLLS